MTLPTDLSFFRSWKAVNRSGCHGTDQPPLPQQEVLKVPRVQAAVCGVSPLQIWGY